MRCRNCKSKLEAKFVDLGYQPLSNAYLSADALNDSETYYPLRVLICANCLLVQTQDFQKPEDIFDSNYAYFSSVSKSWLDHAENYAKNVVQRFELNLKHLVVEVASNDGYLLRNFHNSGFDCIGIEPTQSTADVSRSLGINTIQEFFSYELSKKLVQTFGRADLIIANNVLAHVPDINDFVAGLRNLLSSDGVLTIEFPHLLNLIEENQFETIYHEHYSYLSLSSIENIFRKHELSIFDVEKLKTHGGSLRIFVQTTEGKNKLTQRFEKALLEENSYGLNRLITYEGFQEKVDLKKHELLRFLLSAKENGKKVAAYGAAAKGNTLLNYAGIKSDLINAVYDESIHKQGRFLPGSHIKISSPEDITIDNPDVLLILPWNLKDEIITSVKEKYDYKGTFVTYAEKLEIAS